MNTHKKKCFVLMPFTEQLREVYTGVYRPTCKSLGIGCWRVDEIHRPGSITRGIVEGILDADIVIADLTTRNANVFYELGIAHSVGNTTIMTAQSIDGVPFDIASYRVIVYEQSISGSSKLKTKLTRAIQELLAALDQTNNPLQEALSSRSMLGKKQKTPLVKYVDVNDLPIRMREWLREHGIAYAEDVNRINLQELANTPGLGRTALGKFLSKVVEHDLFDDADALQRVIIEHRIRLQRDSIGRW